MSRIGATCDGAPPQTVFTQLIVACDILSLTKLFLRLLANADTTSASDAVWVITFRARAHWSKCG